MENKYTLMNYLDFTCSQKDKIEQEILNVGFGESDPIIKKFKDANPHSLPQFIFLFRNTNLIGYIFLIKDYKSYDSFPYLMRHNADELPKEEAIILINEGIKVATKYNALYLKRCLIRELNDLK